MSEFEWVNPYTIKFKANPVFSKDSMPLQYFGLDSQ